MTHDYFIKQDSEKVLSKKGKIVEIKGKIAHNGSKQCKAVEVDQHG